MSKFKFKLESLLKLRKMRQDQAEREIGRRTAEYLYHRRQTEAIENQIVEFYRQIREQLWSGIIQITGLIADRRYLNHLHQLKHHQLEALSKHKELLDQARNQLAQAKKQTDMIVKLKERAIENFKKETRRRETIELDDLTNSKITWLSRQYDSSSVIPAPVFTRVNSGGYPESGSSRWDDDKKRK